MAGLLAQLTEKELDFQKWIHGPEVLLQGRGGPRNDQPCGFVPLSVLQGHLDKTKIEQLLDAVVEKSVRHEVDADHVRQHYLRPFAILLCLNKGYLIHHFYMYRSLRDASLPFGARPDDFPHVSESFFDEFKRLQWQFCATEMHRHMNEHLKEEEILPILRMEELGHGGSARVYKIVVEPSYNNLLPTGSQSAQSKYPNTFVLKTFSGHEAEANHKAELDAYRKLSSSSPYIVNCYGSFIRQESNSYNLILEYADLGTFEDFMKNTAEPSNIEESVLFWDRIFDIMRGLAAIHNATSEHNPSRQTLVGWHQDIKPANVLVFSGSGQSPYDCHFKIADLGLSHFKTESPEQASHSDFDAYGTRAYGAPETFRDETFATCPLIVKQDVDIWSAGCFFSEAATWAAFGHPKVREYRRRRKGEVKDRGGAHGEHVFHHEGVPLKVVEEFHQNIIERRLALDIVTRSILEKCVGIMLQETGSRPNARTVHATAKRIIADVIKKYDVRITGYPENDRIGPPNGRRGEHRPMTPPQVPPGHYKTGSGSSRKYHVQPAKTPTWTSDSSVTDNDSTPSPLVERNRFSTRGRTFDSDLDALHQRQAFAKGRNHYSAGDTTDQDPPDNPPSPIARARTSHAEAGTQQFRDPQAPHRNQSLKERLVRPASETEQFEHGEHGSSEQRHRLSATSQRKPNESFDGAAHNSSGVAHNSGDATPRPTDSKERKGENARCILHLEEALRWKKELKEHKSKRKFGPPPVLPGSYQLPILDKRDHVFIIDNSESMRTNIPTIKQVVELHGYILKTLDPTGLDRHYTQSIQMKNSKNSTDLVNDIDPDTFVGPNTDMKGRLIQIFAPHRAKFGTMVTPEVSSLRFWRKPVPEPQRPISFYILTDGKWQPNNDVAAFILDLVQEMEAKGVKKEHVAIQFIRFGNDADGIARMDHLDHGLGLKERGMDIVDTTYCRGNIWKQLLGAVNDWYDEDPD